MMTRSYWHQQDRAPAISCDVAIVGAGIAGASTAFWLKKIEPALDVAVIDAAEVGTGASGRNAGFLLQGIATDYLTDIDRYGRKAAQRLWQFTMENRELLESELDPSAIDLERTGSLIVAGSDEEDERLRASVAPLRADGIPAAYVPPEKVRERTLSRGFFGGLNVPSGAMCNPLRLVQHILQMSRAQLFERHPVEEFKTAAGDVHLLTRSRTFRAAQVLIATNAATISGVERPDTLIRPVRAQMLSTRPHSPRRLPMPLYSHEGNYYVRQLDSGELLLGGARHQHADDEVGFEDRVTEPVQDALRDYLQRHFPWASGAKVQRRWSGTMGFTDDGLPLFGEVSSAPGSFYAGGFNGHGMGMAFRFGKLLAELLLNRARPAFVDLFTQDRLNEQAVSLAE